MDRTRLTLSLEGALHEIEVRVCYLETQFLEPCGSRQYDIREPPSSLIHEQVNADHSVHLFEALGDLSGISE